MTVVGGNDRDGLAAPTIVREFDPNVDFLTSKTLASALRTKADGVLAIHNPRKYLMGAAEFHGPCYTSAVNKNFRHKILKELFERGRSQEGAYPFDEDLPEGDTLLDSRQDPRQGPKVENRAN